MRRREAYGMVADATGDPGERHARRGRQETSTCDALGRAFCAGLLGEGDRAERLLTAGRKVAAQYWRVYGFPTSDSLAKLQPQNPFAASDPALEKIREDALNVALALVGARGRDVRRAFDHLVIDINPDAGPAWLDRIVLEQRQGRRAPEGDYNMLRFAIEGLEAVA